MRGRGQMCRLAWVSVKIIETVNGERSVRGGKTRHLQKKLMENPHRQCNLAETKRWGHRICQVTPQQQRISSMLQRRC